MQITFANQVIAQEPTEGGTDGVEGFLGDGEQLVDSAPLLRAPAPALFARGNFSYTLTGRITPRTFASNGAAVLDMLTRFAGLPSGVGALSFLQDGRQVTFTSAVLKKMRAVQWEGTSVTYELTFIATSPTNTTTAFTAQSGEAFTSQTGVPFTPNP